MTGLGLRIASFLPQLSILDSSLSMRRSVLFPGEIWLSSKKPSTATELPMLSPLSGRKSTTPKELPVLSPLSGRRSTTLTEQPPLPYRSKTAGDEHGFPRISALSWFACFLLVTIVVVIVSNTHPVCNGWKTVSFRCSTGPPFSTSSHAEEQSLLSSVEDSQDDSFGSDNDVVGEQEDGQCWSRTRQWKYRPSERRFPPSPSLIRALQNYESLHGRCTAGKKWESLSEMNQSDTNENLCKYVMYMEGWEGLGNRFMSLVSAFAYALMTDRVLLLDGRRNMSSLICEPFQGSSWNLPPKFPYESVDELPSLGDMLDKELERVAAVSVNLRHEQSDRDQLFFCADVQERLDKVALIGWKSNQYYVPRFYAMPRFWEKLNGLFHDPSLVFTQLSRIFLLPQNAIWAKIERIHRAYLATSNKLVGMQLRSPHHSSFERPILDRMVRCLTKDDHILPKVSEEPVALDKGYSREERVAVFVTSLRREYYEQLVEEYAERGAEDGTVVTVHTMAAESEENWSYNQSVKAFIDMLLLSFSDSLATSGWSTFGYVAQGMGAVYPHIVNTDLEQPESCSHGQSMEPCTHYPFVSSCYAENINNSSEQGKWIKKHIRPCQDHQLGLQLVSS